jgi:hypothetical protein
VAGLPQFFIGIFCKIKIFQAVKCGFEAIRDQFCTAAVWKKHDTRLQISKPTLPAQKRN